MNGDWLAKQTSDPASYRPKQLLLSAVQRKETSKFSKLLQALQQIYHDSRKLKIKLQSYDSPFFP